MIGRRGIRAAMLALVLAGSTAAARAETPSTKQLVGVYVGEATDDLAGGQYHEQREIDMEIFPYEGDGLKVRWTILAGSALDYFDSCGRLCLWPRSWCRTRLYQPFKA